MARLAFMTMVLLKAPREDPLVAGFMGRIAGAFAEAENAPGFIDRSRPDPSTGLYDWGARGVPSTFPEEQPGDRLVHTLSLWRDLESAAAYAYRGKHAEAVRGRRDWCVDPTWPTYFAWWLDADKTPTWSEGYERFDIIHRNGPTPAAFDFKSPFAADGRSTQLARRPPHPSP
jgi:Domain of unknown function (DUF3291)